MIKHEILNGPEFQQEVDKIVAEKLSPINLKISTLEGKITTIEVQTFKNISELTTDVNFISVNNRFVSTAIEFEEKLSALEDRTGLQLNQLEIRTNASLTQQMTEIENKLMEQEIRLSKQFSQEIDPIISK